MIKVSRILKRIKKANLYGWIKPDGSYHKVPVASHAEWSANELGVPFNGKDTDYSHAFDAGWIRVNASGASCDKWTDSKFHRLQKVLMENHETGYYPYYLDLGNDVWSHTKAIITTIDDLLVVNHIRQLQGVRV